MFVFTNLCINLILINLNYLENGRKIETSGKADFLLTSLPVLIVETTLCLAGMLGVAIRQASSKSPEELKKISTRDLKDYLKEAILHQQFLLLFHLRQH